MDSVQLSFLGYSEEQSLIGFEYLRAAALLPRGPLDRAEFSERSAEWASSVSWETQ